MNLKHFKIAVLCALTPVLAFAQGGNITITGKINPSHNGEKVTLIYGKSLQKIGIDSARVKDGTFIFNLKNVEPQVANLAMGKGNHLSIYISKESISLSTKDLLSEAVVSGDKLTEDYSRMNTPVAHLMDEKFALAGKLYAMPADQRKSAEAIALSAKIQEVTKQATAATYKAIDDNPNSYIALLLLNNVTGGTVVYDVAMPHFSKLSDELKKSLEGKVFEERMLAVKDLSAGLKAIDFESTTPEGKKLRLHDVVVTGKYTLVDFWASWCIPCRAENPNVVSAYNAYHAKGFNVLSVSLDNKAENWKAAIQKDGMPWYHVSSLIGFNEPAAQLYGIHVIPQNVLVDSKGVIVASNLKGEALLEKLKQLML